MLHGVVYGRLGLVGTSAPLADPVEPCSSKCSRTLSEGRSWASLVRCCSVQKGESAEGKSDEGTAGVKGCDFGREGVAEVQKGLSVRVLPSSPKCSSICDGSGASKD